jgi:hypothetical protein
MDQNTDGRADGSGPAVSGPDHPQGPGGSARSPARAPRPPVVSAATYWRRRGVALAATLAVLTLVTWAVNGVLAGGRPTGQAAASSGGISGSALGHSRGRTSHRSPGPDASRAAAHGPARAPRGHKGTLAGETVDLGSEPSAKPHPSVSPSQVSTAPAPGSGRSACALGAMVLTIHSDRYRYGAGRPAGFVVDAVSTASQPCGFNLGARFISVVVDSAGTPMWDSASCIHGTGSQLVTLRRGVPASLRVTWDRRTSLSGCSGQGSAIPAGRYTVAAFDAQLHSQPVTFVLTGRAAASH